MSLCRCNIVLPRFLQINTEDHSFHECYYITVENGVELNKSPQVKSYLSHTLLVVSLQPTNPLSELSELSDLSDLSEPE